MDDETSSLTIRDLEQAKKSNDLNCPFNYFFPYFG